MPIPPRQDVVVSGGYYHLYSRGNRQEPVFLDGNDFSYYLVLLMTAKEKFGVLIHHYVLMTNHFHLLVRCGGTGLSKFMHSVQLGYAKYFASKYGKNGHLWQDRFKSEFVDSDEYLMACGNYIEMNPVRAGMVAGPQDWPYSSYHYYAFGRGDMLVRPNPLYLGLGDSSERRRVRYRCRVAEQTGTDRRLLSKRND